MSASSEVAQLVTENERLKSNVSHFNLALAAAEVKLAEVIRELEKMKLEKQKLSQIVMTVCDERDAAQAQAEDYFKNTEDALNQRDKALRLAGDNAEAGHKLMIALDAALARIKVLEGEASLIRVAHGCGKKGPP